MALTAAERQKRLRDKRKADRKLGEASELRDVIRTPFFKWIAAHDNSLGWNIPLDNAGLEDVTFEDDKGGESKTGLLEDAAFDLGKPELVPVNSLGRAELIVASLIDAASELAGEISAFKRSEIKTRIAELQEADLSDPNAKKQAFADMTRLNKMLDQLNKQVRWTFPQWKVTGE